MATPRTGDDDADRTDTKRDELVDGPCATE